jgi:CheY-like chemotaxis protein
MALHRMKKILLADDSERDIELMLRALDENGLANQVAVVRDGAEALEYLTDTGGEPPAVVVLDIKMPRVDGLEVLQWIRSNERLRMTPVVIFTSSKEKRDLLQSYGSGANAYVVKPTTLHQFSEAVSQVGAFWAIVNEPPPRS